MLTRSGAMVFAALASLTIFSSPVHGDARLSDIEGVDRIIVEAQIQALQKARELREVTSEGSEDTMKIIERMAEERGITVAEFLASDIGYLFYFQYFMEKHGSNITAMASIALVSLLYFGILFTVYKKLGLVKSVTYSYNEESKTKTRTVSNHEIDIDNLGIHLICGVLFIVGVITVLALTFNYVVT